MNTSLKNNLTIVAGANGFTGRFVCKELKKLEIPFTALVRPGSDISWLNEQSISIRYGDLDDYETLITVFKGCNSLINIASIGFGNAPKIIKVCQKLKIKRVIFISTTSIFTKLKTSSKSVRLEAENCIKNSGLDYTIIRPTMIFGTQGDRNIIRLIKWINKYPIIPVFKKGDGLQQPVFVKDLAFIIASSLNNKKAIKQVFNIGGRYPIKFREMIGIISKILDKKIFIISINPILAIFFLRVLKKINLKLPVTEEQIKRVVEDKNFSNAKINKTFNFNPKSFEIVVKNEIKQYLKSIK